MLGIVKSHGGFIHLDSEIERGTNFVIYLPGMTNTEEPSKTKAAASAPRGHRELLLVVDDEESIRTVLSETLTRHNYEVIQASDGAEATALSARCLNEIKLVITDLDMPFMDGLNLVKVLKRMKPDIKIVVSTGLGSAKTAAARTAELNALGVKTILTKPYSADKILHAVHAALAGVIAQVLIGASALALDGATLM